MNIRMMCVPPPPASPRSVQAQRILTVPFEVRVPKAPTAVAADGKMWLNYELHITNLFPRDLAIRSVDVLEDGSNRTLQSLDPAAIGKGIQRIGYASRDSMNSPVITAGRRSVLFLWVPLERQRHPGGGPAPDHRGARGLHRVPRPLTRSSPASTPGRPGRADPRLAAQGRSVGSRSMARETRRATGAP